MKKEFVLVKGGEAVLGKEGMRLFLLFLVGQYYAAGKRRDAIPEDDRELTMLFCDEASLVLSSPIISDILIELRKYRCSFVAATQLWAHISHEVLPAGTQQNTKTPKGRTVVICPTNTHGVTCADCGLCARASRSTIIGFPASGGLKHRVSEGTQNDTRNRTTTVDQLRTLHREIGALIAERRHGELEQIRERVALLGFTPTDLTLPKGKKGIGVAKYRDAENPDDTWSGKGRKPAWLLHRMNEGRNIEEFKI